MASDDSVGGTVHPAAFRSSAEFWQNSVFFWSHVLVTCQIGSAATVLSQLVSKASKTLFSRLSLSLWKLAPCNVAKGTDTQLHVAVVAIKAPHLVRSKNNLAGSSEHRVTYSFC